MDRWREVFALETPVLELAARSSVLYLTILLFMRFMPRRTGGELSVMDLVFVLLISESAAQSVGNYSSVGDGVVLIALLMGWNYLLNFLSFRIPLVERLLSAPPVQVVRDGKPLLRNMRREFLTMDELRSQLRQEGVDELASVKAAYVEAEGKLAVIRQ
jgi:uncharacterized membrane protein YcaP (DUF421 family)